jgi:hypothetical protein
LSWLRREAEEAMEIELFTDDGVMLIHENELLSITDEDLDEFRISREDLRRVFTEAAILMKGHTASDRVRPCADQAYGKWEVILVRYSPISDPLMQDIDMRKKH